MDINGQKISRLKTFSNMLARILLHAIITESIQASLRGSKYKISTMKSNWIAKYEMLINVTSRKLASYIEHEKLRDCMPRPIDTHPSSISFYTN